MPRPMPALAAAFKADASRTIEFARAAETLRSLSRPGARIRRHLTVRRTEAIYETAYFRTFLLWEVLLEQSFFRYLCGYVHAHGPEPLLGGVFATVPDAEFNVLGGNDFVSWANPNAVIKRAKKYIKSGLHENVINSNLARLDAFNSVRNRIAHSSVYARNQFQLATIVLAGATYTSAGRFLREVVPGTVPPRTWLESMVEELISLSQQIIP